MTLAHRGSPYKHPAKEGANDTRYGKRSRNTGEVSPVAAATIKSKIIIGSSEA
jgi:hypothetical protein